MASAAEQLAANMNVGAFQKATELHKRIWFTLAAMIVYRLGTYIPDPRHHAAAFAHAFAGQSKGILGHVRHVLGWRGAAHGDLRSERHALYIGLDHRSVARHCLPALGEAAQGRWRGRAQQLKPVYPLSYRRCWRCSSRSALARACRTLPALSIIPGYSSFCRRWSA